MDDSFNESTGGRIHSLFALCKLNIDRASLFRWSNVPTPNRDTSNSWALITLIPSGEPGAICVVPPMGQFFFARGLHPPNWAGVEPCGPPHGRT